MLIFVDGSAGTSVDPKIDVNGTHLKTLNNLNPSDDTFNGNTTFTDADSAYVDGATITVYNTNGSSVGGQSSATTTCGSVGVTFFNPGDGRLNGQPGDRLVVYCNATQVPPNIDVWVTDNSSVGHELAKISLSDLKSVPEGKFARNLGSGGVLFAGSDANGNGYAALQGGPYGGTAKGDWLKSFSCKAS